MATLPALAFSDAAYRGKKARFPVALFLFISPTLTLEAANRMMTRFKGAFARYWLPRETAIERTPARYVKARIKKAERRLTNFKKVRHLQSAERERKLILELRRKL